MAASANKALAMRAVRAASFLEHSANKLAEEFERQGLQIRLYQSGSETVMLPRAMINDMVLAMYEIAHEIRKFDPPKTARR
jgi:hypothetical protein